MSVPQLLFCFQYFGNVHVGNIVVGVYLCIFSCML